MRLVKAFCLALLVALAAMASIGVSSAFAVEEDPEIALCKEEKPLCPEEAKIWGAGKVITGTTENGTEFLGSTTVKCKSSKMKGEVLQMMGASLLINFTLKEINECETCTASFESLNGEFTVDPGDAYLLLLSVKVKIACPLLTCEYSNSEAKLPIDNPGGGTPVALAKETELVWVAGNAFCDKKVKWDGAYKFVGGALSIRLSLFHLSA